MIKYLIKLFFAAMFCIGAVNTLNAMDGKQRKRCSTITVQQHPKRQKAAQVQPQIMPEGAFVKYALEYPHLLREILAYVPEFSRRSLATTCWTLDKLLMGKVDSDASRRFALDGAKLSVIDEQLDPIDLILDIANGADTISLYGYQQVRTAQLVNQLLAEGHQFARIRMNYADGNIQFRPLPRVIPQGLDFNENFNEKHKNQCKHKFTIAHKPFNGVLYLEQQAESIIQAFNAHNKERQDNLALVFEGNKFRNPSIEPMFTRMEHLPITAIYFTNCTLESGLEVLRPLHHLNTIGVWNCSFRPPLIPREICSLPGLSNIVINGSKNQSDVTPIPNEINKLTNLFHLGLGGNFVRLPPTFGELKSLKSLAIISHPEHVVENSQIIAMLDLKSLSTNQINLDNVKMPNLKYLDLGCPISKNTLKNMPELRHLTINDVSEKKHVALNYIPEIVAGGQELLSLTLNVPAISIASLRGLLALRHLQHLSIYHCNRAEIRALTSVLSRFNNSLMGNICRLVSLCIKDCKEEEIMRIWLDLHPDLKKHIYCCVEQLEFLKNIANYNEEDRVAHASQNISRDQFIRLHQGAKPRNINDVMDALRFFADHGHELSELLERPVLDLVTFENLIVAEALDQRFAYQTYPLGKLIATAPRDRTGMKQVISAPLEEFFVKIGSYIPAEHIERIIFKFATGLLKRACNANDQQAIKQALDLGANPFDATIKEKFRGIQLWVLATYGGIFEFHYEKHLTLKLFQALIALARALIKRSDHETTQSTITANKCSHHPVTVINANSRVWLERIISQYDCLVLDKNISALLQETPTIEALEQCTLELCSIEALIQNFQNSDDFHQLNAFVKDHSTAK